MYFLVVISTLVLSAVSKHVLLDPELDEHWQDFKKAFNKSYESREEIARRVIWEQKVAEIVRHNLKADVGLYSYKKGLNAFSDMDHSELVQTRNGLRLTASSKPTGNSSWLPPAHMQLPDTVDWRDEGLVTDVKNQKDCGSCWAFSATGSLEGQQKRKSGKLVSLSEQNLIDCSRPQGNHGCNGGIMDSAFLYVKVNGGIDTEDSYPYIGKDDEQCNFQPNAVGAICTGVVNLPEGDEEALMQAVATVGPISVAIDASQSSFQMYSSGVYDDPNCSADNLDHGVLVIGYGTEDGKDYWLVKNSWGTSWGLKGYIKMSRNKVNQCGIATHAVYPLV